MAILDARMIQKRSTFAGEIPTIAPSNDHLDGTWTALDIYPGELFINDADHKIFTSMSGTIYQIYPSIITGGTGGDTVFVYGINGVAAIQSKSGSTYAEGDYSFAIGQNTNAYGAQSTAMGYYTTSSGAHASSFGEFSVASGQGSVAMGNNSRATEAYSIAVGNQSVSKSYSSVAMGNSASGTNVSSIALGSQVLSSGYGSTAMGDSTVASANAAFAANYFNIASNVGAAAFGTQTVSNGYGSFSTGSNTLANADSAFASGYATSGTGYASSSFGSNTLASSSNAVAMGYGSKATGSETFAHGFQTLASGNYAHSEGNQTSATTDGSHAEGYQTVASGTFSHAEGNLSIANGSYSHSEGESTISNGYASKASGLNSIANGDYSLVHASNSQVDAVNSAIIAGDSNYLSVDAVNSAILGGQNISGYSANTVYVPSLNPQLNINFKNDGTGVYFDDVDGGEGGLMIFDQTSNNLRLASFSGTGISSIDMMPEQMLVSVGNSNITIENESIETTVNLTGQRVSNYYNENGYGIRSSNVSNTNIAYLRTDLLSDDATFQFPGGTTGGTLALLSDLTGATGGDYIKLDGTSPATTDFIELGNGYGLKFNNASDANIVGYATDSESFIQLYAKNTGTTFPYSVSNIGTVDGIVNIFSSAVNNITRTRLNSSGFGINSNLSGDPASAYAVIRTDNLTGLTDYNYQMPAKSGVIALLSDIATGSTLTGNYLSISGGTVTGNTRFSANLSATTYYSGSTLVDSLFARTVHSHVISDVTELQTQLNGKANLTGNTFTGGNFAPSVSATTYYSGSTLVDSLFARTVHTHTIANVTNLQSSLNNKADLTGATFSGPISASAVSAATLYSGSTDLSTVLGQYAVTSGSNIFMSANTFMGVQNFINDVTVNDTVTNRIALRSTSVNALRVGLGFTTVDIANNALGITSTSVSLNSNTQLLRASQISCVSPSAGVNIGGIVSTTLNNPVQIGGSFNGAAYSTSYASNVATPALNLITASNTNTGGTGNIVLSTGTNTGGGARGIIQLGTSATQPIGMYGTSGATQATTAITQATLVVGVGTAITNTTTIAGYTMQQIVQALKATGLLA